MNALAFGSRLTLWLAALSFLTPVFLSPDENYPSLPISVVILMGMVLGMNRKVGSMGL